VQESVIRGVSCPSCGGSLELAEGITSLRCKYCNVSLLVRGEKGVLKFHQLRRVDANEAVEAARRWFGGMQMARDLRKTATFETQFLIYLPFWRVSGQVVGWVFGNKIRRETVKRGNRTEVRTRKEPVERSVMRSYVWTDAACDVSEFGVESVEMPFPEYSLYDRESLQKDGMVFEPTEARTQAVEQARCQMIEWARQGVDVDEVTFEKLNVVDLRTSIVYYPLWVLRYGYKGRTYQVVTDGATNQVLYGRAPGSTLFRVMSLVGTMFAGSFVLTSALQSDLDFRAVGFVALLCVALMLAGFWKFRYGGEVRKGGRRKSPGSAAQLRELRKLAGV